MWIFGNYKNILNNLSHKIVLKFRGISYITILLILSGCTTTSLTSYVAPEFKDFKAKKILCSGTTLKLHFQKKLIEGLKRRSKAYNVEIIDEYAIFPPMNDYHLSDLTKAANNGIFDSFLEISLSESLVNSIYHSPQIIGADTVGTIGLGGMYSGTTTFHYSPGYWGTILSIPFSTRLIEPKTLKKIWISEGNTIGGEGVKAETLIEKIGEKIIEKLAEDGIIKER